MDIDEIIRLADAVVSAQLGRPLNDCERHVLRECWHGKRFQEMEGWAEKTLKDTGARLWKCFEQALGGQIRVSKSTFQSALTRLSQDPHYNGVVQPVISTMQGEVFPSSQHPFGDRGCITDPTRFFDREEILRRMFEGLQRGCSQSLVGESQVGKSSILSMICTQGPQQLQLPQNAFISLDMQCISDEEDFFAALCHELDIVPICRGYELKRKLRNQRYIICLDEVEKMTHPEKFSGDERSELRGLASHPTAPFTLVIASRSPLSQLFPDSPEKTSPLANICCPINVGNFSPDIAKAFIEHRLRGTNVVFTEDQIDDLISRSQGHPARLQEYAAELYDRLTEQ
jgi:hypothetical protein